MTRSASSGGGSARQEQLPDSRPIVRLAELKFRSATSSKGALQTLAPDKAAFASAFLLNSAASKLDFRAPVALVEPVAEGVRSLGRTS
jgi:hypothetical protein